MKIWKNRMLIAFTGLAMGLSLSASPVFACSGGEEKVLQDLKIRYEKLNKAYGDLKVKYDVLKDAAENSDLGSGKKGKKVPKGVPKGC